MARSTHRNDKVEEVRAATAHIGGPVAQLALLLEAVVRRITGVGGAATGEGLEELGVLALYASCVKAPGRAQLRVDVSEERNQYEAKMEKR